MVGKMGRLLIWTIKDIKNAIEKMTSADVKFDCIIFIEGNRGLGKSTLGYKILQGLKVEQPFNAKRDLVYTRDDTLKHLASKINGCIFSDEMINVAYRRDFYQEGQKDLLKAFDMYRDSRNVFIGCIPKFIDLDNKIQKVCKLRLSVVRRGVALVHMQVPTIFGFDPWDVKNNQRVESKWSMKGTKNPRYGQFSTCRGILKFGDLTPKQREEYDAIKFDKRNHIFKGLSDDDLLKDPEQIFMRNVLKELKSGKFNPESFNLLCAVNNKNPETIRRKINNTLREEGEEKRWKDFCLTEKAKQKKDKLGFEMPQAIEKPNKEIEQEDRQENKQNDIIKGDPVKLSIEPNGDEIFGFES